MFPSRCCFGLCSRAVLGVDRCMNSITGRDTRPRQVMCIYGVYYQSSDSGFTSYGSTRHEIDSSSCGRSF